MERENDCVRGQEIEESQRDSTMSPYSSCCCHHTNAGALTPRPCELMREEGAHARTTYCGSGTAQNDTKTILPGNLFLLVSLSSIAQGRQHTRTNGNERILQAPPVNTNMTVNKSQSKGSYLCILTFALWHHNYKLINIWPPKFAYQFSSVK